MPLRNVMFWLFAAGCGGAGGPGDNNATADGLPAFHPSVVVYADGCEPLPEAVACIEANPVQFLDPNAPSISSDCVAFGYTCCNPADWMSAEAAACIAEQDPRLSVANHTTMTCYPEVFGPMFGVYEQSGGSSIGIGVHAGTGRITWFDDGSGTFS